MASKVAGFLNYSTDILSGAIDVICVSHANGEIRSTPFHVRYGRLKLLRSASKTVSVYINGQPTEVCMKIGEAGECYFVEETDEDEDGAPLSPNMISSPIAGSPPDLSLLNDSAIMQQLLIGRSSSSNSLSNPTAASSASASSSSAFHKVPPPSLSSAGHSSELPDDDLLDQFQLDDINVIQSPPSGSESSSSSPPNASILVLDSPISSSSSSSSLSPISAASAASTAIPSNSVEDSSADSQRISPPPSSQSDNSDSESSRQSSSASQQAQQKESRWKWRWGGFPMRSSSSSAMVVSSSSVSGNKSDVESQTNSPTLSPKGKSISESSRSFLGAIWGSLSRQQQQQQKAKLSNSHGDFLLDSFSDIDEPDSAGRSNASSKQGFISVSLEEYEDEDGSVKIRVTLSEKEPAAKRSLSFVNQQSNNDKLFVVVPSADEKQQDEQLQRSMDILAASNSAFSDADSVSSRSRSSSPTPLSPLMPLGASSSSSSSSPSTSPPSQLGSLIAADDAAKADGSHQQLQQQQAGGRSWWPFSRGRKPAQQSSNPASPLLPATVTPTPPPSLSMPGIPPTAQHFANFSSASLAPRKKVLKKSLRPTSDQIKKLGLKFGVNEIDFVAVSKLQGVQRISAKIFLWKHDTKVVISDVDGTITRSDALGHVVPLFGKDWSHAGIATLYQNIQKNGYNIFYLTTRSILQAKTTRDYIHSLKQGENNVSMPLGPVITSPNSLMYTLAREVYFKKPEEFKIAALQDIRALYDADTCPFYAGFGNRQTDVISYRAVAVPPSKIFTINPKGLIQVLSTSFKSYSDVNSLINEIFPPIQENVQDPIIDSLYNQFAFWKLPPREIIL